MYKFFLEELDSFVFLKKPDVLVVSTEQSSIHSHNRSFEKWRKRSYSMYNIEPKLILIVDGIF